MNKKTLLTSLMSIAMLASITTGATYALFTAEDTANIVISSAKVKVEAKVLEEFSIKSLDTDLTSVKGTGTFSTGGTATVTDGNITLDKIVPGDRVEFKVQINNLSNVDVAYKIYAVVEGELATGLVFEGVSLKNKSVWKSLPYSGEEEVETLDCVVELPSTVGNEYQEKTANIQIVVEAVQGNAELEDSSDSLVPSEKLNNAIVVTPETFADTTFVIGNDYALEGEFINANYEFSISNLNSLDSKIIIDGTNATFPNAEDFRFTLGAFHNSLSDIYDGVSKTFYEKIGTYTIQNFKLTNNTSMAFGSISSTINILNNESSALYFETSNSTLNIKGNTITGDNSSSYKDYNGDSKVQYGISIMATNYEANIEYNTISGTKSHAIGINGRQGDNFVNTQLDDNAVNNSIVFKGNTIEVLNSTRGALKIWADQLFAPATDTTAYTEKAQELVNIVNGYSDNEKNNITLVSETAYTFIFDGYKIK